MLLFRVASRRQDSRFGAELRGRAPARIVTGTTQAKLVFRLTAPQERDFARSDRIDALRGKSCRSDVCEYLLSQIFEPWAAG